MKVLARQPMSPDYWPSIIVEADNGYYMIVQILYNNVDYPNVAEMTWIDLAGYDGDAPISSHCEIRFGKSLTQEGNGPLCLQYGLNEVRHVGYIPMDYDDTGQGLDFPTFWAARDWFLELDPIAELMKELL